MNAQQRRGEFDPEMARGKRIGEYGRRGLLGCGERYSRGVQRNGYHLLRKLPSGEPRADVSRNIAGAEHERLIFERATTLYEQALVTEVRILAANEFGGLGRRYDT